METIRDKTAVVIGGGSGVGRGIALGLAAEGAHLVVADIEPDSAAAVADEIRAAGGDAVAQKVDGTAPSSLSALARFAEERFGAVHILSNNVGVMVDAPLTDATEAQWAWVHEFNFMSIVRGVNAFIPHLRRHGGEAHIINTASMAALLALGGDAVPVHLGLYTSTKHAILGYSETLRQELASENIGVSVLCPGMVASNLPQTTARNRPERHGGPYETDAGMSDELARISMKPEQVGPIVVRAVRANRLHILTHPEALPAVEARHQTLVADFDFAGGKD